MHEKARAGIDDNMVDFESIKVSFTTYPHVYIFYINRRWNRDADFLAKQGLQSNSFFSKWYQP